ncbi:dual specificity protein phosphatase [Anaeramoeba flamelloides]|uniref:protein-tyrosine-phosphatase n=1 Tax=Anaeramoeba flamelloides TaxID=1746091 RepID=A0AAV7Z2I4_9EUKA|nr:dual specificity protein phosphatase [Anaeramoeba flamelloides]KAJ6244547.1 dual specificity protein phosphatase [Anaeramoeba flamelloides]
MGNSIDKIDEGLYLGGQPGSSNKDLLKENGITHIVNVSHEKVCFPNDFVYLHLIFYDTNENFMLPFFEEIYGFMDKALSNKNNAVFVHCSAGVSRSATAVICYLMKKNSWTFMETYKFVKEKRGVISPNQSFGAQLEMWEKLEYTLEGNSELHQNYQTLKSINKAWKILEEKRNILYNSKKRIQMIEQIVNSLVKDAILFKESQTKKLRKMIKKYDKWLDKLLKNVLANYYFPDFSVKNWEKDPFYRHLILPLKTLKYSFED